MARLNAAKQLALAALLLASCGRREASSGPAPPSPGAPAGAPASAVPIAAPAATMLARPSATSAAFTPAPASVVPPATPAKPRPTLQRAATFVPQETHVQPPKPATPGAASVDPSLSAFVDQAKADLARRQGTTPGAIAVLEARSVTWPDPGLGCPQPGMAYRQVPVDGLLIRLSLGGRTYSYHGGGGKPLFLCERPEQMPPGSSGPDR